MLQGIEAKNYPSLLLTKIQACTGFKVVKDSSSLKDPLAAAKHGHKSHARLKKLAWLLDNSITIPFLKVRIGLEGLLGLIPGIGDAVGSIISSYIVAEATRLRVPVTVLLHMSFNILLDFFIGLIPLVGDIFDFAWKANLRNVALLERYIDRPRETTKSSRITVAVVITGLVLLMVAMIYIGFAFLGWLLSAIT